MKIQWGGTFVKPALDYCYFKWTLQFQPKPPQTSCVSPLNTVVSSHCDLGRQFEKAFMERDEKGAAAIQCSPTKEHGFGYLREGWPWQPLLCVLWILFVWVSMLGLEAYFLCDFLTFYVCQVCGTVLVTRECVHTVLPGVQLLLPLPNSPFFSLPSLFHLSQAFPVSSPELKRAQRIRLDSAVGASFPKGAL